jgi:hypothetical protein
MESSNVTTANAADEKLGELILYISAKCESDPSFGKVKLNKILFLADFIAYERWGAPITGQTYFALEQGPAPKHMLPTLQLLQQKGWLAIAVRDYYGHQQHKPVALREAVLDDFAAREISLVDEIIEKCWNKTGLELSEASHGFIGWKLANLKEDIPYEVALVGKPEPNKFVTEKCKELAAQFNAR